MPIRDLEHDRQAEQRLLLAGGTFGGKRASFVSPVASRKDYGAVNDSRPLRRHKSRVQLDLADNRLTRGVLSAGAREWTASFGSIDFLWETIREKEGKAELRSRSGWRGRMARGANAIEGWVITTLIAVALALLGYSIIQFEAFAFDFKDGLCTASWLTPGRFCCPPGSAVEACSFHTWAEVLKGSTTDDLGLHHVIYVALAVLYAALACWLTLNFTCSTSVQSRKEMPRSRLPSVPPTPSVPVARSRQATNNSLGSAASSSTKPIFSPPDEPRKMYFAAGSGIPETKAFLGGVTLRGFLGGTTLAVKSVGLSLAVASGLTIGKEGPFVHIAACIANLLSRIFDKYDGNEVKRREIVSAAAAAGVAASFGAPIGGVIFSWEEVSSRFSGTTMARAYFCGLVTALTLQALDPYRNGKLVLFETTYDQDTTLLEYVAFAVLGVIGGVWGAIFCRVNPLWTRRVRRRTLISRHPIIEVALTTLLTAAVSYYHPLMHIGNTELVSELFKECALEKGSTLLCPAAAADKRQLIPTLATALLFKAILVLLTFGLLLPAGLFIPTMATGGLIGRIVGLYVEQAITRSPYLAMLGQCDRLKAGQACIEPGLFAIVAAAAALAGTTRMVLSLAVICAELTGSIRYTLPIAMAILIAKATADAIEPRGIYDLLGDMANLPYLDPTQDCLHQGIEVSDLVDPVPTLSTSQSTLGHVRSLLDQYESRISGFPVIADAAGDSVVAYISLTELASGIEHTQHLPSDLPVQFSPASTHHLASERVCDFGHLCDHAPICLSIHSSLQLLHELFLKLGCLYVIVVDAEHQYVGLVDRLRWTAYCTWLRQREAHTDLKE